MDATATYRPADFAPPEALGSLERRSLLAGIFGLGIGSVGWLLDPAQFFQSYLIAYIFWVTISLGCLGLAMLHHMSRGAWGIVIRRPLEAAAATIFPLMTVLFVPLLFGLHDLYEWTHEEVMQSSPALEWKLPYLNEPRFLTFTAVYFAAWGFLAWRLRSLSKRQDETEKGAFFRRLQGWSAVGFLALALTMTLASVDWLMSLDPHWFSSIFGLWFFTGSGLSGLAFITLVAGWLAKRAPMARLFDRKHFHDYGKLLFAFVMLWAYLSFSQLLLIWSGNLPEEIPFYLARLETDWLLMSVFLLLGQFVVPFLILLSATIKQRKRTLAKVALWILAMRWVDYAWHVVPTLEFIHGEDGTLLPSLWIDLALMAGIGGVWLWYFFRSLDRRPLLPVNDPFLDEYFDHE